jgi:SulP family sulfate permease
MIGDIDYSGAESIRQLHGELKRRGVVLVLSNLDEHVMKQLERDTILDLIGKDHVFGSYHDAVVAYQNVQ